MQVALDLHVPRILTPLQPIKADNLGPPRNPNLICAATPLTSSSYAPWPVGRRRRWAQLPWTRASQADPVDALQPLASASGHPASI
jgi:hypothetical protein